MIQKKSFILKDYNKVKDKLGRTVVLRNARPEDSADLIKYLKTTSAETPYLIREPDEITILFPRRNH